MEFDNVPHNQLNCELIFYGVQGGTLSYISETFYWEIAAKGYSNNHSNVISDAPQEMVLAPMLLLCFINDLLQNVITRPKLYNTLLYKSRMTV